MWWVARWVARMLASLAVVVACSLGAATLPTGVSPVAPGAAGPVAGLRADADAVDADAERPNGRVAERPNGSVAERQVDTAAERQGVLALDRQRSRVGVPEPQPVGDVPPPTGRHPFPVGQPPAPAGPRAPPAR